MKATHKIKLVSLTTALGVFLVGCGGGPNNEVSRTVTGSSSTGSTIPYASPIASAGNGTVGYTNTDTLDQIAADTRATNNAIAGINSKLDQTVSSSKKASNWGMVAGLAGLALAGFGAMKMVGGMKAYNDAHKAAEGKDAGFMNRLWQGGVLGNRGESFRAQVNTAQHKETSSKVTDVDSKVVDTQNDVNGWGGVTSELAGAAFEEASKAKIDARKTLESTEALRRGQEMGEKQAAQRHQETLRELGMLQVNINAVAANVIQFNDDMQRISGDLIKQHQQQFDALTKRLETATTVVLRQVELMESSDALKAEAAELTKKMKELNKQNLISDKEASLNALIAATMASKDTYDTVIRELQSRPVELSAVEVPAGGSTRTNNPAARPSTDPRAIVNLVDPKQ